MNQETRVAGELTGPIATTANVVNVTSPDGIGMVPAVYSSGMNATSGSTPKPLDLLKALKRRLALALGLGVVLSAGCLTAGWFLLPPPNYQAVAKVMVRTSTPQIMWKTVDADAERDESRSQKSQIIKLRSRLLISAALQQKGISDLKMIREHERPVEWLAENLQAQFLSGTEILQISMEGKDPEELARLVNAVMNTYYEEVADNDQKRRLNRKETLKKVRDSKFTELKNRREAMRALAQKAGSDDRQTLVLKQQYAIELGTDVRRDLREVQSQKRSSRP